MVDETFYSVRFKYGAHTIIMFVDSQQRFSEITTSLLEILHDRFPDGLTINHASPETTPLPDADAQLAYALPVNGNDLSQGWKDIRVTANDTPVGKGLRDGCAVAISFDLDEPNFVVDVPSLDEGPEEEEDEEEGLGSDA